MNFVSYRRSEGYESRDADQERRLVRGTPRYLLDLLLDEVLVGALALDSSLERARIACSVSLVSKNALEVAGREGGFRPAGVEHVDAYRVREIDGDLRCTHDLHHLCGGDGVDK